jgi:hypothetical protein
MSLGIGSSRSLRRESSERGMKCYEIHVRGEIPRDQMPELKNVATVMEPALTVLRGSVADQAALQGILAHVHALGLELVEVRRVPDAECGAASAKDDVVAMRDGMRDRS